MSVVEERVVEMQFNNAQFAQGINASLADLQRLNRALQLQGATKGLTGIGAAASQQTASLQNVETSVQSIADRFRAMGVVATTTLATVAHQAVTAGGQLVKSLTIDPVLEGFREYETNMNSIQTILANTAHEGTNLNDVTAALDELNHYSDQTIYNFSEMARNIGTFTAAGVSLDTSTEAIKGIANLAAISGSNSEQASAAMYQLSQALAAGRVTLEDWNSVVNAGMGGKVFQDALMETARVHGVAIDDMVEDAGSFRLTLQEGWLTGEIMTETLSKFTGDLTAAQLETMGYNQEQIAGILEMGQTAQDAATKVKTMSQLINTLKESATSGWAETWELLFGDFEEARTLFTSVSETLGGFISSSSQARNQLIGDWKELGGRTVLIEGISNAFQALISVLRPIRDAFRQIFPRTTAEQLYELTVSFRDFMERLKIGGETADNLRRTFAGVFAIFGIGWEVIKQVGRVLFDLFQSVGEGSGGFLSATATVGDFLVALHEAVKEGEGLTRFFDGIKRVIEIPLRLVQRLGEALGSLFGDVDGTAAAEQLDGVVDELDPLQRMGRILSEVWSRVLSVLDNVWDKLWTVGQNVSEFFSQIAPGVASAFEGLDFNDILAGVGTGAFTALILTIRNALGGGDGAAGIIEGITDTLDNLSGTLTAMQNTLRAATLLQIAAAVGILAVSANTLSKVDADGLKRALTAMAVMMGQLLGTVALFEKVSGADDMIQLGFSLILLSTAILILTSAVKSLSELEWEELARGLTGTAVLLGAVAGAAKLMSGTTGLISTGLGLLVLAGAIRVLVTAVTDLSGISWEEMARGLVGVGGLLASLTLFTRFSGANRGGLLSGAGILLLALGIKVLASALEDFIAFSWEEIGRGLATMAGGLLIIGAALRLIPPSSVLSAAGVLIVAASLGMIGDAIKKMGRLKWNEIGRGLTAMTGALAAIALAIGFLPASSLLSAAAIFVVAASLGMITDALKEMAEMSWEEIGRGLVALAGSLGIIAAAMYLMTSALPGAAALLVVSASLTILLPVLQAFSEMSLTEIGTSLLMLAGVFAVFGAAAFLLAPVVPVMIALGAAVALLGVGMLAAGAGVLAFSVGLTALAAAGGAGTAAIVGIVSGLIGLIPMVMEEIGKGLIAFAEVIATAGPAITEALVTVLNSLIDAIIEVSPRIVDTLLSMLVMMYNALADYVPQMVDAGLRLLTGVLDGIADNIDDVIASATDVAVAFIEGIGDNLPRIINAGVAMILKFINGVATAIDEHSAALGEAGANLAVAIVQGMVRGLASGIGVIAEAAKDVAGSALNAAKGVLGIESPSKEFEKIGNYVNDGFRKGLDGNKDQVWKSFNDLKAMLKDLTTSSTASAKERAAARKAYSELTKNLDDERNKLAHLAVQYDILTARIERANEKLNNAIKTRDDYNKQIRDQYSDMPSATGETNLQDYLDDLRKQIENTNVFANALQRLRNLGLNDETYQDLLAQGPDALPFVQELLEGGRARVNELNTLSKSLDRAGASLGKSASTELYQAAVDSAKGFVKGLEKERANIEKQMDKIADAMVRAIKKKLGIKSPSRVFAELGGFSAKGLAEGLRGSTSLIEKSARGMGEVAIDSLQKSLSSMSNLVTSDIDMNPVITPVLDLSSVKKNASQIGGMIGAQPISVGSGYAKAVLVSEGYIRNRTSTDTSNSEPQNNSVVYNQYNNSPKALSSAEIYRQTRNQLSKTEGVLAI